MDLQTYQNSYRIRQKWHYIDNHSGKKERVSTKKQIESKKNISPSVMDKQTPVSKVNDLGNSQNKYLSKQASEISEKNQYERLMKLKAKQFVSRIKKERTNQNKFVQRKETGKETGNEINSLSRVDSSSPKSIKQPQIRLKNTNRNKDSIIDKDIQLPRENKGTKSKAQILKPILTLPDQITRRKKPIQVVIIDQPTPSISKKKVTFEQNHSSSQNKMQKSHRRSRSVNTQSSSPQLPHKLQKYLYLNIQDEKKIDLIYKKIKKLSSIDYSILPGHPTRQKIRPFYL